MILRNEHLIGVANNTYKNINSSDLSSSDKSYTPVKQTEQFTKEGQQLRLDFIEDNTSASLDYISQNKSFEGHKDLKGNIENFIGMSQIPTGILGPLVVEGGSAKGPFYVPLATSEGTLVASYSRGARACRESGEIRSVCLKEGVQRSPIFKFKNLDQVAEFLGWISKEQVQFGKIVAKTSNYAQLINIDTNIEGNQVILNLSFTTGDAAGQNMVTLATHAICAYIEENNPVKPDLWFIESNFSGDKKATVNSFVNVRGKKVSSEIVLKKEVVIEVLKTTPQLMFEYWQTSFMGAVKCGAIGAQGHFSNGLAAIFIACGQDAACVSEASVGITRMEVTAEGDLYCSVTLPNLIVGTVGGGTSLPTQKECLEIMDCYGAGNAKKFAEICGALCLAGEISIIAALSAGQFAAAHAKHGRR
jgi:hydroxymethylglutaryl-CoA reductase (NADPH)